MADPDLEPGAPLTEPDSAPEPPEVDPPDVPEVDPPDDPDLDPAAKPEPPELDPADEPESPELDPADDPPPELDPADDPPPDLATSGPPVPEALDPDLPGELDPLASRPGGIPGTDLSGGALETDPADPAPPLTGALVPVATAPEPAPAVGPPADDKVMSLVDHLGELRTRIFRALLAVAVCSAIGFYFSTQIRNILISPLPTGQIQVLGPGDAFFITLKISIVAGVILAMPVILWQAWSFVAPGLTASERRTVRPWVPLALFFFALGVSLAYVVLPYATTFLLSFTDDVLVANIAAGPYFDFVTTMFLAFGLVMEFPILLFALARVGVLTSAQLKASRRYVLLGTTVFAAVITPGGDLVSPLVMGVTMYLMYEATVFVIARTGR